MNFATGSFLVFYITPPQNNHRKPDARASDKKQMSKRRDATGSQNCYRFQTLFLAISPAMMIAPAAPGWQDYRQAADCVPRLGKPLNPELFFIQYLIIDIALPSSARRS